MSQLILFNKPYHVLSQFSSQDNLSTLKDYIPIPDVYAAGRLDKDSEGLLLLTNDGQLQHQLAHPRHKQKKHYWVEVEGVPTEDQLSPLRSGIELNDGRCKPAKVSIIETPSPLWQRNPPVRFRKNSPTTWLAIVISEGRNRQVRRMTAAISLPTLRLIRHQIGEYCLGELQPGEYRVLSV